MKKLTQWDEYSSKITVSCLACGGAIPLGVHMKGASVNQTHKEAFDPRKAFAKRVEVIEALPQSQRWRAIKNLLFEVKPELRELDRQFCEAIAEERNLGVLSLTGASKSGSTRRLYSMPQYMYSMLHLVDPEFTKLQEDPDTSKQINLKIARTFPEYCLATRI